MVVECLALWISSGRGRGWGGVEMASVNYAFIQASIKELMDAYCEKIISLQVEEKCVVGQACRLIVGNSYTHWL